MSNLNGLGKEIIFMKENIFVHENK